MASVQCATCGRNVLSDHLDRLPPWCPDCGADLKRASAAAPTSEPGGAVAETPAPNPDAALREFIQRMAQPNRGREHTARGPRLFRGPIVLLGLVLLGVILAMAWVTTTP